MTANHIMSELYTLGKEIDTGAEGHYARVYQATSKAQDKIVAFKLMRHEYLHEPYTTSSGDVRNHDAEWQAFAIEVRALKLFAGHPMVTDFIDCGFIDASLDDDPDYPEPHNPIISLGTDTDEFISLLGTQRERKWRPYIATEYVNRRGGTTFIRKQFPVHIVLEIVSQFVDLLVYVQDQGYIYGDHKLDHTYWIFQEGKLKVIDWNGGKFTNEVFEQTPEQLKREDVRDLVLIVMYDLLVGQATSIRGKRPLGGRSKDIKELRLPDEFAGHDRLQSFFDEACQWRFQDARNLRTRLDELMIDYGIARPDLAAPPPVYVAAKNEVLSLITQVDETLNALESIKQLAFNRVANTTEYPPHLRAEFESIIRHLEKILASNQLFTKINETGVHQHD